MSGQGRRVRMQDPGEMSAAKRLKTGTTLLETVEGDSRIRYHPKTRETRVAWEQFLDSLQRLLGDDELLALRECAEECLQILRDTSKRDLDKKPLIEEVLDIQLYDEFFHRLLTLAKKMNDFVSQGAEDVMDEDVVAGNEEHGVSVVYEDDEEEEEGGDMAVSKTIVEEEEDEDGVDTKQDAALHAAQQDDDDDETEGQHYLDAKKIDAHWIQRTMGKLNENEEPHITQNRAEQVFALLADEGKKDNIVETELMELFSWQKFDFVRLCLKNRWKIVWCTKMTRAKDDARAEIMADLRQREYGDAIIAELERETKKSDSERGFRRKLREEHLESMGDKSRNVLDLKRLAFENEGRTMSISKCPLPEGSKRIQHPGYEEIFIPSFKPMNFDPKDFIPISQLPSWMQTGFRKPDGALMDRLNYVQSQCFPCAFGRDDNMLLCAPTGAGKTNVAVLTIMREISKCVEDGEVDEDLLAEMKIVYIAPMKALVQEVVGAFSARLKDYNIKVSELTGDTNMTREEVKESHVIVTTPEKWDIVTRKTGEKTNMQHVRLIIIDEIHLLHDARGPVLESIIARTIRLVEATQEPTRLVGLSATLPNYEDVARVLRVQQSNDPEVNGLFHFKGSFRPVPLEQQYIGVKEKKPLKRRAIMNDIVFDKVMAQAGKSQVIVFVHSRKDTVATAKAIRDKALKTEVLGKFLRDDAARKEILLEESESAKDQALRGLLPYGFGIHHAGLSRQDRMTVEGLFADKHIQVLVSTATLAWGVNLPAHTVIIKGTQVYNPEKCRWTELSSLDVMQMIGRAGRPGYDVKGEGIIITSQSELQFYLSLLNQQLPIESQFVSRLVDQMNAEIVMGTVQNTREAITWLGYTYLYVRMLKRPELYGVSPEDLEDDPHLEQRRADLVHTAAVMLDKASLIKYDRKAGIFEATDLGRVASRYYLTASTIMKFNENLKPTMHELDLFRLFCVADEFKYMSVREEEKMELGKLLEQVPIPIKENVDDPLAKTNVLLQAYISRLKLDGFALMSDMVYITQSATRIVRAMFEIVLRRGWAQLAEKLLNVAKQVEKRIWLSHSPLRQFKGIPLDIIERLERKDFSWDRYYNLLPADLAALVENPSIGKKLYNYIHMIPRLELDATAQPITRSLLRIELVITADFQFDTRFHGTSESFWVLVEDPDGEQLLHTEPFILKEQFSKEEFLLYFHVPMFEPMPPQYFIKVVSDRWLWSTTTLPVSFRQLILPEKTHGHTELYDMKALSLSSLGSDYDKLYSFPEFNSIQTQVFHSVFKNSDSVLVCAPSGSGKTLCAEMALFRLFDENQGQRARAVYVAPTQDIVDCTFREWQTRFERGLGKNVMLLTGETVHDLKCLEVGDIILATAQHWDQLSRKWQRRKNVTSVKLFIADDLHMLDSMYGPTLEIVVSRMRYISSLQDQKIRIVGLAHSLLHARDVGLWMGANPQSSIFNFHPNTARPVRMDVQVRGFDQPSFSSRTLAMYKPTYLAIKQHSKDKPVIVYTPSKKITVDMVVELLTLCSGDVNPKQFLGNASDLGSWLERIDDELLSRAVELGIGFFYEGMPEREQRVVSRMFSPEVGMLQVVVMPYTLAFKVPVRAHMVVIAGTQFYNGREHRHADYYLSDILQMLSRAGYPQDDQCIGHIMCHTSKKESLKKMVYDPYPVESQLDNCIVDHFNAEIVNGGIKTKQDAVDYLTWTYLYRRLRQNPNFYKMYGVTHEHISEYLSELTENSIQSLQQAGCITVEENEVLEAANLGMIAAYYYIQYTTIEIFASSVNENSKVRQLTEILSGAMEFEDVLIRHHEEAKLEKLSKHCGIKQANLRFDDPHCKVSLLLHSHFSRRIFSAELIEDLNTLLPATLPLVSALVDVIGSNRWLSPLLECMELSQMIVQGMWSTDNSLLQIPHFTPKLAGKCKDAGIETVFDIAEMDDSKRDELLGFNKRQMAAVASFCNQFPDIEVDHQVVDAEDLHEGSIMRIVVTLRRNIEKDEPVPSVHAPLYPRRKEESWWLVVGNKKANYVHAQKKVTVQRESNVKLDFTAPKEGVHNLTIYFMCDSYLGIDQVLDAKIKVKEPLESESEESEED